MGLFFEFGEYDGRVRGLGTPEEWAQVAAMSDAELQRFVDLIPVIGSLPVDQRPEGWQLARPAQQELANREVNRRMDAAGRTSAVKAGLFWSAVAALLKRPNWWAYGATGAVLGYGNGRASARPRGSW